MKRVPNYYKTEENTKELVLSTRSDSLGNIFHCVEYLNTDGTKDYALFGKLSSALDFINSNFK